MCHSHVVTTSLLRSGSLPYEVLFAVYEPRHGITSTLGGKHWNLKHIRLSCALVIALVTVNERHTFFLPAVWRIIGIKKKYSRREWIVGSSRGSSSSRSFPSFRVWDRYDYPDETLPRGTHFFENSDKFSIPSSSRLASYKICTNEMITRVSHDPTFHFLDRE